MATTDPARQTIWVSGDALPPLLDKILVHEAAHAAMEESGVSRLLSIQPDSIGIEELIAWFLETYAIEIVDAVSSVLGRAVCIDGLCLGG